MNVVFSVFQVSLFCMAIGQDPKELSVAVVNYENNGEPCREDYYTKECPVSLGTMGLPTPNEHLQGPNTIKLFCLTQLMACWTNYSKLI